MRSTTLVYSLFTLVTASIASTLPLHQQPFLADEMTMKSSPPSQSTSPSLADLLTRSKHSRIFYDYARESTSISTRLVNPLVDTTVFAPIDSAILNLARKPHQGPIEPTTGAEVFVEGSREDEESKAEYLERWISSHLVHSKIDLESLGREYETGKGETKVSVVDGTNGGYEVMPGNVEVVSYEKASNGLVLYIKGTLPLENVD